MNLAPESAGYFIVIARLPGQLSRGFGRLLPTKIRWKIVAPYVVLTLIVAAAGTLLATRRRLPLVGAGRVR